MSIYIRIDADRVGVIPELPTNVISETELQAKLNKIDEILNSPIIYNPEFIDFITIQTVKRRDLDIIEYFTEERTKTQNLLTEIKAVE